MYKRQGIQLYTQEEADDIIIKAHNAGFNVSAHAVGDVAVDVIPVSYTHLDVYKRQEKNGSDITRLKR